MTAQRPVAPAVRSVGASEIRRFAELAAQYPDVVSLTLGEPGFRTPAHIRDAAARFLDAGGMGYTTNAGRPELRRAAADYLHVLHGLDYSGDDDIVITSGASQALDIAFRTILEPGVEVILPAPSYPGYQPLIEMAGARPVFVDTTAHRFQLDASLLAAAVTDRTRCVVLPCCNPTGIAASSESLQGIADVLAGTGIHILADEIYSAITFESPHRSIASIPSVAAQTIVVNGLSKSHAMTGWRIGLVAADPALCAEMLKVHQYSATCASVVSQAAALEAFTNGRDDPLPMVEAYRSRRDLVVDALDAMGLPTHRPDAGFFAFPSISPLRTDSTTMATSLLAEEQVAVVPGSAFGPQGDAHVRLSFAAPEPTLKRGLDRLATFVDRNTQRCPPAR